MQLKGSVVLNECRSFYLFPCLSAIRRDVECVSVMDSTAVTSLVAARMRLKTLTVAVYVTLSSAW
jgi:hypothetical protein